MRAEALRIPASPLWAWIDALWKRWLPLVRRPPRRLRLCESLALGERRFVAVVEFESARFLLGGTASSLVLLSRLSDADSLPVERGGECERTSEAEAKPRGERW